VRAALRHGFDPRAELLAVGTAAHDRFPALRGPLALLFARQPRRCTELVVRVGLAMRLGADTLAPLAALALTEQSHEQAALPADWHHLVAAASDLAPVVAAYRHAQHLLGNEAPVPAGVRHALDQPQQLARELAFLEQQVRAQLARADLAARAATLRSRLADQAQLLAQAGQEAGERLRQASAEAGLAAAEAAVVGCFRARLEEVAGPLPADVPFDDDLLNATLLMLDIKENRRLLRRLVRAALTGQHTWREAHPANAGFLQQLAGRGVDTTAWLGALPRRYRCAGVRGGSVRLHLETEPLRILQMGNLFDTCLSFGGINAFSSVANACELNKRVIYATDGAGRVVGRKLIGIAASGGLVGFHTYIALTDQTANRLLRQITRRYAAWFAARCNLGLADDGVVPTLFAERWYDDGVVPWSSDDDALPTSHAAP
jgi:hypothetical protein